MPRRLDLNVESRKFTEIFPNERSMILFSPLRIFSLSPSCGPSTGGTRLSLLGTAFTYNRNLKVRFRYGENEKEVECDLDVKTRSILCITPNFEENVNALNLP